MRHNRNWKKTGSAILAVCLIGVLLLSNQSFGVFAEEEESLTSAEEADFSAEETSQDTAETMEPDETDTDTPDSDDSQVDLVDEDTFSSEENPDEMVDVEPEEETVEEAAEQSAEDISTFSDSANENTWQRQKDNVTVAGTGTEIQSISVKTGTNENLYSGDKVVTFDYNITSESATSGELTFTISDIGIMSDDNSLEIWHVKDDVIKKLDSNLQISEGKVQFKATELGEFIAVSNVATVDLAQSKKTTSIKVSETTTINKTGVNISYNSLEGCRQDGTSINIAISSNGEKKYRVAQSENKKIKNSIWFSGEFATNRNIIIDGINTEGSIDIAAGTYQKLVSLQLRGENQLHHIGYGYGSNNHNSKLVIENYGMASDTSGKLYIPYKMNDRAEERNYVFQTGASNYWAYAGLGGNQEVGSNMYGLTIVGGTIRVITQNKDGSTAIGAGGNGDAQLNITGGDITAICSGTGTAIGGGIGWLYRGGTADIAITGGKVYAENVKYRSAGAKVPNGDDLGNIEFGGVAIGSGSSVVNVGSSAKINIGGNSQVTAYARYGNGIGSGNSYNGTAATANITIDGNSVVTTNALGGGTSKTGQGGSANITVKDDATVNCVEYSQIKDKWDTETNNILGAFGIGGGNSAGDAKGGSAIVNVSGGTLNCNGGNIGGGDATGTGAGGDAGIYVSAGTLDCASIGGGNSITGTPGSVTSDTQTAGVVVTGGTLKAGTIGGGTNSKGEIGFATANISGGNIQGQFILSNTDGNKKCTFTMSGGTIDNTALWSGTENSKYQMAQKNGGAVYLTDPNGEVNISGGTIQNCEAELGGAVYMTAGTVNLSGTGKIQNCQATGSTENNQEAQGGAIYLKQGTVNVSGGDITQNSAQNGAGVYLAGGNLNVSGKGTFNLNSASENGGAAYLANGTLTLDDGTVSSNAAQNGGGFYLAGGQLYVSGGTIQSNTAQNGAGAYVADSTVRMFGGEFTGNQASENGGGMYISSTNQAADVVIRSGTLIKNTAGNSDTASDQGNGGAIAVVSSNSANKDHVVIGLRKNHNITDYTTRAYSSFSYNDEADNNKNHNHASCPTMEDNTATGNGGGIYMSSSASVLDIYCLLESGNTATADETGASIMSAGGSVNIGDIGDNGPGEDGKGLNNTADAVGNVYIQSKMLVKGGNIKLYGNTDNPKFAGSILVDIEKAVDGETQKGSFNDYRFRAINGKEDYKIEYFENFEGSGKFESQQYDKGTSVYAIGNMFEHTGWKILGWDKNKDAEDPTYKSGDLIPESAWEKVENQTGSLTLYAIWTKITYTVEYDANLTGVTVSGVMPAQTFVYNDGTALKENVFKAQGKRFVSWNTEKDGQGTSYADKATEKEDKTPISTLTGEDGVKITLYAQWKNCSHTAEDQAILSYQANESTRSITEACDCGGYTATVQIAGEDIYYDGEVHPATLTGSFLAGKPTITYTYKATANGEYRDMPNDTTVPEAIGYYKATITAQDADGEKSVFVEYQIKSPAAAATIDATIQKGEQFSAFTNNANCTVAQDDAFTVRYDVQKLNAGVNSGSNDENNTENNKVYKTAPVLTISQVLPAGTTIIMQTSNTYWYNNNVSESKEISLTSFVKMGTTSEKFEYDTSNISDTQSYRFIVDFSGVSIENYLSESMELNIDLKYAYTNPGTNQPDTSQDKTGSAEVTIVSKADFKVIAVQNTCQVTAVSEVANTRYAGKNLVWKITPTNSSVKLPSDAELTMSATVDGTTQTGKYSLNAREEFIIPFKWSSGQKFTFALNSDQEALKESDYSYTLKATLCVGSNDSLQPKAVEDQMEKASGEIELQIPTSSTPSVKISGTDKVLNNTNSLKIHIQHTIDLNQYSVEAKIEKKDGGEYKGDNGRTKIDAMDKDYTLGLHSTTGSGSYRVCIVVTDKNGNTVHLFSSEPYYYFILQ